MTTLLNGVCLVCEGDFLNIINEGFFISTLSRYALMCQPGHLIRFISLDKLQDLR